jgi:hypothetical protein
VPAPRFRWSVGAVAGQRRTNPRGSQSSSPAAVPDFLISRPIIPGINLRSTRLCVFRCNRGWPSFRGTGGAARWSAAVALPPPLWFFPFVWWPRQRRPNKARNQSGGCVRKLGKGGRDVRIQISEQHRVLSQKLLGHDSYYGITGNSALRTRVRRIVVGIWRKWLDRRSWKSRFRWSNMGELLGRMPLPAPRVVHSVYPRA